MRTGTDEGERKKSYKLQISSCKNCTSTIKIKENYTALL